MLRNTLRLLSAALLLSTAACSGSGGAGGAGTGSLTIEVTDAPIDPSLIARAVIEVDSIRVHRASDADSGFLTVFEGGPIPIDLARLRNGLTHGFRTVELPAGSYGQVRLRVTDAELELRDGRVFSTRSGTIQLTAQDRSGYKVFLSPAVEIREGVETRVLLDFLLPKTFSPIPANDLASARLFHLHPNVRAAVLQETGELRGVVTTTDDLGATLPAANAVVYVFDPGVTDPDFAVAATLTDDLGQAAILGVPVGTYDVRAVLATRSASASGLMVAREQVTTFELTLQP